MSTTYPDMRRTGPDYRRFALALAGLVTGGLTAFLLA
jgi:hypothetical protein